MIYMTNSKRPLSSVLYTNESIYGNDFQSFLREMGMKNGDWTF